MKIGFIGLGFMGSRIATSLLEAGHQLTVCDRNASTLESLCTRGAAAGVDPAQTASGQELVLTCLPGPKEVRNVMLDRRIGVLAGIDRGAILADHTTNARACALEVAEACESVGVQFLDAPVTGRPPTLTVFAGGDAEAVIRARSAFDTYSPRVIHTGPNGTGASTKLVSQLVQYSNFLTLCEAFVLGAHAGLHVRDMAENINGGNMLDFTRKTLLDRSFSDNDGAPMALIAKDMRLIQDMARDVGLTSHLVKRVNAVYRAGVERGWGDEHFARVIELFEANGTVTVDRRPLPSS